MCAIQWVLLKSFIFGLCISVTEAVVVLATFDGKTTYSIGSEVELVCSITPYNNEMTWFVNNDPYADCIVGTCNPYSNKPYAFSFTFNETAGVFKLAIGSVTYSHAELSFACDDGIERKQISFNVTADKGQNNSSTTNTSNSPTKPDINNQITVTNEGNGDNDDSELSIGAIVGIVLGCVLGLLFLCMVVFAVCFLYKRAIQAQVAAQHQAELEAIQAQVAAQHQAELEEEEEKLAQEEEQWRRNQLKEQIKVLMNYPGNSCIIMKWLLLIGELSEEIVKQTKIMFSSPQQAQHDNSRLSNIHHNRDGNQLYEENEIDQMRESIRREQQGEDYKETCDEYIKEALMQKPTISSIVMQGVVNEELFFNNIISQLLKNTEIYKNIEKGCV